MEWPAFSFSDNYLLLLPRAYLLQASPRVGAGRLNARKALARKQLEDTVNRDGVNGTAIAYSRRRWVVAERAQVPSGSSGVLFLVPFQGELLHRFPADPLSLRRTHVLSISCPMHACDLAELAAIIASNAEILIRGTRRISSAGLEAYWAASKCRIDRWSRAIKQFQRQSETASSVVQDKLWTAAYPCMEEIISSELLTRTWTSLIAGIDSSNRTSEGEPIARSVFISHLEARHRILHLLVNHNGNNPVVDSLNRLRFRAERWNDMLLGSPMLLHDVSEFTFDIDRTNDFAKDLRSQKQQPWGRQVWPLLITSLRSSFRAEKSITSPNVDLNENIASSILACFGPDVFDSTGQFRSLWEMRLTNATRDTQGLIDQLMLDETFKSASQGPPIRRLLFPRQHRGR